MVEYYGCIRMSFHSSKLDLQGVSKYLIYFLSHKKYLKILITYDMLRSDCAPLKVFSQVCERKSFTQTRKVNIIENVEHFRAFYHKFHHPDTANLPSNTPRNSNFRQCYPEMGPMHSKVWQCRNSTSI